MFGQSSRYTDHGDFLNSIEKSYEYEERLSEIESKAAPAVQQIVEQVRQGKCPQLSIELRDAWKRFLIAIARRTPESQDRVVGLTGHVDAFYEASKHVASCPSSASVSEGPAFRHVCPMPGTRCGG